MNKNLIILIISLGIFLFACKTKKVVNLSDPKPKDKGSVDVKSSNVDSRRNEVYKGIMGAKNVTPEFSFLAEADYFDGKQSVGLNLEISAKKDQYIYLNAKALGFVNVARLMIQPDSIRILDLINRKYISASYQFMQNFAQVKIGFNELQNMIWANAFYDPNIQQSSLDSLGQQLILLLNLGSVQQKAMYNKSYVLQSVSLFEQAKSQEMQVDFTNFKYVDGISYPHAIVINISGEKKIACKFEISNFAGSIKKEPQFVIPKSYKVQVY